MNAQCRNGQDQWTMHAQPDTHTRDNRRKCGVCSRKYRSKSELTDHIKAEHLGMRFICNYVDCERRYKSHRSRSTHMKCHGSGPGYFQCDSCDFYCDDTHTLTAHNRSHTRNLIVWCRYCGAGFSQKGDEIRHEDSSCKKHPRRLLQCFDPSDPEIQRLQGENSGNDGNACQITESKVAVKDEPK